MSVAVVVTDLARYKVENRPTLLTLPVVALVPFGERTCYCFCCCCPSTAVAWDTFHHWHWHWDFQAHVWQLNVGPLALDWRRKQLLILIDCCHQINAEMKLSPHQCRPWKCHWQWHKTDFWLLSVDAFVSIGVNTCRAWVSFAFESFPHNDTWLMKIPPNNWQGLMIPGKEDQARSQSYSTKVLLP